MSKTYIVKEQSGCGCGSLIAAAFIIYFIGTVMPYIAVFLVLLAIAGLVWYLAVKKPRVDAQKAKDQEEAEIAEIERQNELKKRRILAMQESQNIDKLHSTTSKNNDSDWDEF